MEDKRLKNGGHFPNEFQTLLLKAALYDKSEALSIFLKWLNILGLNSLDLKSKSFISDFMDKLDLGSQRLMPLVIENLGTESHPYFPKFIGYKKNLWVRNQRIFLAAKELLKKLNDEGIPTILLKGLSLANVYYPRNETRPMNDGDILIPFEYKSQLINILKEENSIFKIGADQENMIDFVHASHFFQDKNANIDVHWNIFTEYSQNRASSIFAWDGAIDFEWDGIATKRLNPTHDFFVVLVSGRNFENIPPIRWVADCVMILKNTNGVLDWNEFIRLSKDFSFKPFIQKALPYLKTNFWPDIPTEVMEKIDKLEPSHTEVMYYKSVSDDIRKYGFFSLILFGTKRFLIKYKLFLNEKPFFWYMFKWYKQRFKNEFRRLINK